jgi:hypothetical protein
MTTEARTHHEPAGGDGLLFLIATTIVAVVTVEALFIAFSSWWLMTLVLLFAICAAIGICAALVRLIDHDTPFGHSQRKPQAEPANALAVDRRALAPRPRAAPTEREPDAATSGTPSPSYVAASPTLRVHAT